MELPQINMFVVDYKCKIAEIVPRYELELAIESKVKPLKKYHTSSPYTARVGIEVQSLMA